MVYVARLSLGPRKTDYLDISHSKKKKKKSHSNQDWLLGLKYFRQCWIKERQFSVELLYFIYTEQILDRLTQKQVERNAKERRKELC